MKAKLNNRGDIIKRMFPHTFRLDFKYTSGEAPDPDDPFSEGGEEDRRWLPVFYSARNDEREQDYRWVCSFGSVRNVMPYPSHGGVSRRYKRGNDNDILNHTWKGVSDRPGQNKSHGHDGNLRGRGLQNGHEVYVKRRYEPFYLIGFQRTKAHRLKFLYI